MDLRKNKRNQEMDTDQYTSRRDKRSGGKFKKYAAIFGKSLVIILLLAILSGIIFFVKGLMDTNEFLNKSYTPRETTKVQNETIDVQKDPISILLLGLDDNSERELGSARTDSILLLTLNPTTEKVNMVSIPRDTYVHIQTKDFDGYDKINSAFVYGGIEGTIDTVENLMNVPINYYATLDFQAFEDIVDAVGGIEMDVPFTLTEQNSKGEKVVDLKEGRHTLNGEEALAFARTRYIDNDIERGKRQQQVLEATAQKAMDIGTIAKYKRILEALDGHITTDMPSNKILSVAQSGLTKNYSFESYVFDWMSFDYLSYGNMVGLNQDSLDYISHRLRYSLELDEADERDAEGYEFQTDGLVSPTTFPQDGMAIIN